MLVYRVKLLFKLLGIHEAVQIPFRKGVRDVDSKKLPSFRSFCEREFHLSAWSSLAEDGRKAPLISASTVFQSVFLMGSLGLPSLLQCDQILRTPVGFKWFGQAGPAVSDSTMARSLESMEISKLRSILYTSYRLGVGLGVSKCPVRSGKLRIGIVDGSQFGRFMASCFEVVGSVSQMLDLEEIPKRGKELPSSYALLRRLNGEFGKRFVDLILGDALYLNAPFFNLCLKELKSDVLVKTDDASRLIIQDAMSLFDSAEEFDIPTIKGVDSERMCSYEIMMSSGFELEGVEASLSVAWVREEDLRTGERGEFWVVTSFNDLVEEESREVGHWRWDVENNGFKALNQTVHTKRLYSHNKIASEAILQILFIVFNLLQLFLLKHKAKLVDYPGMKQTQQFAVRVLRNIMIAVAYLEYG